MASDPGTPEKPIQTSTPSGTGYVPQFTDKVRQRSHGSTPALPCHPYPGEKRGVGQAPRGPRVPAMHHSPCQRACESPTGLPPKWLHLVEPSSKESQLQTTVSYVSFFRVPSKLSFPRRLCMVGGHQAASQLSPHRPTPHVPSPGPRAAGHHAGQRGSLGGGRAHLHTPVVHARGLALDTACVTAVSAAFDLHTRRPDQKVGRRGVHLAPRYLVNDRPGLADGGDSFLCRGRAAVSPEVSCPHALCPPTPSVPSQACNS